MEQKVFDFETLLADSFKTYLVENGLTEVYTIGDNSEAPDEKYIIGVDIVGPVENNNFNASSNSGAISDALYDPTSYIATLSVGVFTNRTTEKTNDSDYKSNHAFRVSIIRKLMLKNAIAGKMSDVIPYVDPIYYNVYSFDKLTESGNIPVDSDNSENDIDLKILSYEIRFQILEQYWMQ